MKPILFNTEMVKAILDGRKVCTRRVVKDNIFIHENTVTFDNRTKCWGMNEYIKKYSRYQVGDTLYVRETFSEFPDIDNESIGRIVYRANGDEPYKKWKPSIHMPKEYARIFLHVKNVRVDRLQDISDDDIYSEEYVFVYEFERIEI